MLFNIRTRTGWLWHSRKCSKVSSHSALNKRVRIESIVVRHGTPFKIYSTGGYINDLEGLPSKSSRQSADPSRQITPYRTMPKTSVARLLARLRFVCKPQDEVFEDCEALRIPCRLYTAALVDLAIPTQNWRQQEPNSVGLSAVLIPRAANGFLN